MNRRPASVAAIGEQRPVLREDGDIGRPFGDRELIDGRQLRGILGHDERGADVAADAEHQHPIDEAIDDGPARRLLRLAFFGRRSAARRFPWLGKGVEARFLPFPVPAFGHDFRAPDSRMPSLNFGRRTARS